MNNSVFEPVRAIRFWRAPLLWIKYLFSCIKGAWWRIKYGFAPSDVWNFDSYLMKIFALVFEFLADNHCGHPSRMTDEEWTSLLKGAALCFRIANEESDELENPYEEEYFKIVGVDREYTDDELRLRRMYREKDDENCAKRQAHLRLGLRVLSEHFEDLWD